MSDIDFIPAQPADLVAEVMSAIEAQFFRMSIPMPDGYSRVGVALADSVITLFITGEGVPAMQWDTPNGGGWKRTLEVSPHA